MIISQRCATVAEYNSCGAASIETDGGTCEIFVCPCGIGSGVLLHKPPSRVVEERNCKYM
jgi:hypothetical protein